MGMLYYGVRTARPPSSVLFPDPSRAGISDVDWMCAYLVLQLTLSLRSTGRE